MLLFAYILNFLFKLESTGCECAMDWRRNYIMFYMAYMLLFTVTSLLMLFAKKPPSRMLRKLHAILSPVSILLGILFIVFTFQYVHRLHKEKCGCSEDMGRTVLTLVAAIDAAVFAVMGLVILISLIGLMLGLKK